MSAAISALSMAARYVQFKLLDPTSGLMLSRPYPQVFDIYVHHVYVAIQYCSSSTYSEFDRVRLRQ